MSAPLTLGSSVASGSRYMEPGPVYQPSAGRAVSYGAQSMGSSMMGGLLGSATSTLQVPLQGSASSFRGEHDVGRSMGSVDAFSAMDTNGDGLISRQEWEAAKG